MELRTVRLLLTHYNPTAPGLSGHRISFTWYIRHPLDQLGSHARLVQHFFYLLWLQKPADDIANNFGALMLR